MSWLLLPEASSIAPRVDALFFTMLGITGTVAAAIFVVITWFCIRYRRGNRDVDRTDPPLRNKVLEIGWTLTPLAIFLGIFVWAAIVYAGFYTPSANAMTVFVVGKQWMWKVEHANGRREIGELHLPLGQPVRVVLATEDVIHSFYVPAFRMKQDAVPGRYTALSFTPTRLGSFELHCSEYCGTGHSRMGGKVIVMRPAAFQRWLGQGTPAASLQRRGFALFRRLGCSGCHAAGSTVHAPDLNGIYGRVVHLQDGRTVVADEAYIHDSIMLPKRDVVAGFEPIMPSFQGQVSEADILDLIAYLKSTGQEAR